MRVVWSLNGLVVYDITTRIARAYSRHKCKCRRCERSELSSLGIIRRPPAVSIEDHGGRRDLVSYVTWTIDLPRA